MKSSVSLKKIPHALGKKSIARKADEMEDETGIEPNRGEIFIASRTRADGTLVSNEARVSVDNLKEVMILDQSEASSHESRPKDAFEQVFGPESSGRVRRLGHGPTPSKYFSNFECTSSNGDMTKVINDMQANINGFQEKLETIKDMQQASINGFEEKLTNMQANIIGFGQKLEIVGDAVYSMVKQNENEEKNAKDEKKKKKKKKKLNLHQSLSINSDQGSGISKSGI